MDASYEKALPPEQWRQVLVNIEPGDLCNVMLTSRYMSSVASCSNLWAEMEVNMEKVRDNGLMELYSIDRFKKVTKMTFSDREFNQEQLETALHDIPTSPLEDIEIIHGTNLSQVPAELLANAVSGLKTADLSETELTTDQCIQLLEASISSRSLIEVNLRLINLSGVPPDLLAMAFSRLQSVNLDRTELTTEQSIQLLKASLSSRSLVYVRLSHVNLSGVPHDLLARAISRLQYVKLDHTQLTTKQCIHILEASLSSNSLVDLDLEVVNLCGVTSDLLARAVSNLQDVNLFGTRLSTEQCIQLLEATISSRSLLVYVNLGLVNLSEVPSDLLARAVSRLQFADLSFTELTTEQSIQVLEASLSPKSLVHVDLAGVNLNEVPADLLAKAVSRFGELAIPGPSSN